MSGAYLARRLLLTLPTLFGVCVVVFVLLRVVPGDPVTMMIGVTASEEDIPRLRALYGLDRSIAGQFVAYIGNLVQGDLGISITRRQPVGGLILGRLPATLELSLIAMAAAVLLGGALAVAGAYWRARMAEHAVDGFAALGLAIPDFLWGLLFILVLGVLLPVLPITGRVDPRLDFEAVSGFLIVESLLRGEGGVLASGLRHAVLPALALALPLAAIIARVLKSSIAEAMVQDYVLLARVKGFGRARIILREALRNALVPTVALTGVQFTFLLGGTVLVERIFAWPGLGSLAIEAVVNRDLPLIQGIVLTFAVLFIALNLAVDALTMLLNPRLRHG